MDDARPRPEARLARLLRDPRLRRFTGAAISLLCILWLARSVDVARLATELEDADKWILLGAIGLVLLNYVALAWRWAVLFWPHRAPTTVQLFSALSIAQLANTLLPARLSPILRFYLIGEIAGVSKAFALSTIVGEKTIDSLLFLGLVLAVPLLVKLPDWLWAGGMAAGALFLPVLALILWTSRLCAAALGLSGALLDRLPWLNRFGTRGALEQAVEGLAIWRDARGILRLVGASILVWGFPLVLNGVLLKAMHLEAPFSAWIVLLIVQQAGVRIPALPANIGVFHYLTILALSLYHIPESEALGYAIVAHLVYYVAPSLAGFGFLLFETIGRNRQVWATLRGRAPGDNPAAPGSARTGIHDEAS